MGMNTRSMLVAAAIAITFVPLTALAQRGGGGGGATVLSNPAFVYMEAGGDGGLFLLKYDGSAKQRLTSPGGSGSNVRDLLATWSPDLDQTATGYQGTIAFFRQYDSRYIWGDILAVPADGSRPPVKLRSFTDFTTPPPETGNSTRAMSWSPNGSHLIYVSEGSIWALKVATGEVTKLLDIVWDPVYAGFSKPCFSLDLAPDLPGYQGQVAFAVNGNAPPGGGNGSDIGLASVSIDADGEIISAGDWSLLTTSTDWAESQPVWSPDGSCLAWFTKPANAEPLGAGRRIDVFSLESGLSWLVTTVLADRVRPSWSPDGTEIGFSDARNVGTKTTIDIFRVKSAGGSAPVNVTKTDSNRALEENAVWSPGWIRNQP